PVSCNALFCFDTDQTASWGLAGDNVALSGKVWNSTAGAGHNGSTGCMQFTGNYSTVPAKGDINSNFSATPVNLTGQTISFWINFPADMTAAGGLYQVAIYAQSAAYGWDATYINVTTAGWQQYSWVLPATLTN